MDTKEIRCRGCYILEVQVREEAPRDTKRPFPPWVCAAETGEYGQLAYCSQVDSDELGVREIKKRLKECPLERTGGKDTLGLRLTAEDAAVSFTRFYDGPDAHLRLRKRAVVTVARKHRVLLGGRQVSGPEAGMD